MKPGIAISHDQKLSPILDMDEFWTPEWEIHALRQRVLAPKLEDDAARDFQALEAFDD